MTKKERKELGLNISVLMSSIIDKDAEAAEIANLAIDFCKQTLTDFPELKESVDEILDNAEWDAMISWAKYKKLNLI